MKMIRDCAWHELNFRPREGAGNIPVVPAKVERNLAERVTGTVSFVLLIKFCFETVVTTDGSGRSQPVISFGVSAISEAAAVEIGAAPEAIGFGDHGTVDKAGGNFRGGPVKPGHEEN